MKIYLSDNLEEKERFNGFELVNNYYDADDIVIVPGGLSSLNDLVQGVRDGKDVYLYNKDLFYSPLIEQLYRSYERGIEPEAPSEYMNIESDLEKIIEKLEEKKNGKINNGESSKLL